MGMVRRGEEMEGLINMDMNWILILVLGNLNTHFSGKIMDPAPFL